ncbi:VID27 cytoplasmic protein-domain-containing protein [Dunaliella salina]|uniref:VID27 cytoplasmic protein-domain-containing protein n=1 Tax=Dunaliella salina TaxID=3046 RepID=A0ABQ7GIQ5_DUNSA|nr:VID27 cytoplasmic protein-domain-containing protein [Dunaliella salina]|eukprot:KAF5834499.1 VID27 cytoplasmic protein-domain-containing protein [Dunaliella salina]
MFYNMYGVENDEEARSKVLGEDYAGVFFTTDAAARVEGGVEDKNISFSLTPNKGTPMTTGRTTRSGAVSGTPAHGGSSFLTPSRVMLTNAESQMNLLTPDAPNNLYQADIEAQKIVTTWNFNKDGADIPMRDIHHDTKSAGLEQRSTFLGLDNNRLCRGSKVLGTGNLNFAKGSKKFKLVNSSDTGPILVQNIAPDVCNIFSVHKLCSQLAGVMLRMGLGLANPPQWMRGWACYNASKLMACMAYKLMASALLLMLGVEYHERMQGWARYMLQADGLHPDGLSVVVDAGLHPAPLFHCACPFGRALSCPKYIRSFDAAHAIVDSSTLYPDALLCSSCSFWSFPFLPHDGQVRLYSNKSLQKANTSAPGRGLLMLSVVQADGKVRLYSNKSLQKANTSIPGLGAPITAIDITYDGKWVLATTDKYLMVVKTTFTTDKGEEGNAFTKPMGSRGSVPHLLRLKPEDMAHTGSGKFTKGKFTWITEAGQTERYIVANCGNHSVVWNFNRVKGSGTNSLSYGGLPTSMDYVLQKKDEEVVDAAFLHSRYCTSTTKTPSRLSHARDAGSALVVATPHHLSLHGDDDDSD